MGEQSSQSREAHRWAWSHRPVGSGRVRRGVPGYPLVSAVVLLAAPLVAIVGVADSAVAASLSPPTGVAATSLAAAAAQAKTSGQPVPIPGLTTANATATALPSGVISYTESTQPERVWTANGWAADDPTLVKLADGDYAPREVPGTVALSGGGSTTPLASFSSNEGALSIGWDGTLPTPTASGATLTYANVMSGVNLVLTATAAGGVSEVLIVQSRAAATDPGLANLTFPTETKGLTVSGDTAGNLRAVNAAGTVVYQAPAPLMWDSSTSTSNSAPRAVAASLQSPGTRSRTSFIPTTASSAGVTLQPSSTFLNAAKTTYPLYIDPNWIPVAAGAPAFDQVKSGSPCNGVSEYDDASADADNGELGAGYNGFAGGCDGADRAYYQWTIPSAVANTDIQSATVDLTEVYSASCSVGASVVTLSSTGTINSSTDWNNQPNPQSVVGSGSIGPACSSDPALGVDISSYFKSIANSNSVLPLVLQGDEKSTDDAYLKRFSDNPTLQILYYPYVNAPSNLLAFAGDTTSGQAAGCDTSTSGAPQLPNGDVTFAATVSSPAGGSLNATFALSDYSTGTAVASWGDTQSSGYAATQTDLATQHPWTNGNVYGWNVTVSDGITPAKTSATCYFTVLTGDTNGPAVTSSYFPPSSSSQQAPAARTGGTFSFCTSDTDVASYTYTLDSNAPQVVTAPGLGACVTVPITISAEGSDVLTVTDTDSAGNGSKATTYLFNVADPAFSNGSNGDLPGDLNGDGHPDVLAVDNVLDSGNKIDGVLNAYTSPGNGTLNEPVQDSAQVIPGSATPSWTGSLLAWNADFIGQTGGQNGGAPDGYNDLLYHLPGSSTLSLTPGNGLGNFDWTTTPIQISAQPGSDNPYYGSCPTAPTSFANITQLVEGYYSGTIGYDSFNTASKSLADVVTEDVTNGVATFWSYPWDQAFDSFDCPTPLDNTALAGLTLVDANSPQQPATVSNPVYDTLWGRDSSGVIHEFQSSSSTLAGTAAANASLSVTVSASAYPTLISAGPYSGSTNPTDLWTENTSNELAEFVTSQSGSTVSDTTDPSLLGTGDSLASGETLVSPDGAYELTMETNGNLVEQTTASPPSTVWQTNTTTDPGSSVTMQTDCNLVVTSPSGQVVWNSGTGGASTSCELSVSPSSGKLLIHNASYSYWSNQESTQTFVYTAYGNTTFTAPSGIVPNSTAIYIDGAPGGSGAYDLAGGQGSRVQGYINVTPGESLTANVGAYQPGGPGGAGGTAYSCGSGHGSNGGNSSALLTSSGSVIVEAGGGGGAGGYGGTGGPAGCNDDNYGGGGGTASGTGGGGVNNDYGSNPGGGGVGGGYGAGGGAGGAQGGSSGGAGVVNSGGAGGTGFGPASNPGGGGGGGGGGSTGGGGGGGGGANSAGGGGGAGGNVANGVAAVGVAVAPGGAEITIVITVP